jgi:hypothetical protein
MNRLAVAVTASWRNFVGARRIVPLRADARSVMSCNVAKRSNWPTDRHMAHAVRSALPVGSANGGR